ncbi:MAG: hypothetical protein H7066_11540 [Cytophagaceae bacterium]|nr:hypothetical protein [Gemmatimonadaceae bacterium]
MTSPRLRIAFLFACTALAGACMSDNEYRAKSEAQKRAAGPRAEKAAQNQAARGSRREQSLAKAAAAVGSKVTTGERAERLAKADVPFTRMSGYVVRGTDESSFVKCGDSGVHYTRMSAGAVGLLVQRYRFKAPRPLSPVYFTISGRILDDTISVGTHEYISVVEIERVYPEVLDERPACAAPTRGSLIERQVSKR